MKPEKSVRSLTWIKSTVHADTRGAICDWILELVDVLVEENTEGKGNPARLQSAHVWSQIQLRLKNMVRTRPRFLRFL